MAESPLSERSRSPSGSGILSPKLSPSHSPRSGSFSHVRAALERIPAAHTWTTKLRSGDAEVQRMSRLAVLERVKQPHRYRLVVAGEVVGSYVTRQDLEAALLAHAERTGDRDLYNQWMASAPEEDASPRRRSRHGSHNLFASSTSQPDSSARSRTESLSNSSSPSLGPAGTPPPLAPLLAVVPPPPPPPAICVTGATELRSVSPVAAGVGAAPPPHNPGRTPRSPIANSPLAERVSSVKQLDPRHAPTPTRETVTAWDYDEDSKGWTSHELVVRLAEEPFAHGGMRSAYHMAVTDPDGEEKAFVAKEFNEYTEVEMIAPGDDMFAGQDPEREVTKPWLLRTLGKQAGCELEARVADQVFSDHKAVTLREFLTWHRRLKLYKVDVEMQGFCQTFARAYNAQRPPKPVNFLDAFLIVCHRRLCPSIYACEPLIQGEYIKHNNNMGGLQDRDKERNTPQAFSHFTYVHSQHQHIIVDIQGVGDNYTDPQVHSVEGRFGMGNLGQEGIDSFFRTHRCNNICEGLGLTMAPPPGDPSQDSGTVHRPR